MWEYLTVFLLAATPLVELLVVIPLGIGYGLDPVMVAAVTVAGNHLPVLAMVLLSQRWSHWRRNRDSARAVCPGPDAVATDSAPVPVAGEVAGGVTGGVAGEFAAEVAAEAPGEVAAEKRGGRLPARRRRAWRIWNRYGTPGLALAAPLVTGAHIAVIVGLALGSPRWRLAGWMLLSIVFWTIVVTLLTLAGIEGIRHIFT